MRTTLLSLTTIISLAGMAQPTGNEWLLPCGTEASRIRSLPNGHALIIGRHNGPLDYDPGPHDLTHTTSSSSSYTAFMIELDPSGAYIGALRISSTAGVGISQCHIDAANNMYLSGSFAGTVDLDPDDDEELLFTAVSDNDAYFLKLNPDRELVWGAQHRRQRR